jgi:hypothetical protein
MAIIGLGPFGYDVSYEQVVARAFRVVVSVVPIEFNVPVVFRFSMWQ